MMMTRTQRILAMMILISLAVWVGYVFGEIYWRAVETSPISGLENASI